MADEQVNANGCSWRSGAKVEKKLMKQWFIRTTKFARPLLDGLDDPTLKDWRDIIKLQKHWLGDCNGYSFDLSIVYDDDVTAAHNSTENMLQLINVWTESPEDFNRATFIAVTKDHVLNKICDKVNGRLKLKVLNPFNRTCLPVIVADDDNIFGPDCDVHLGMPATNENDRAIASRFGIVAPVPDNCSTPLSRDEILRKAHDLNIGGYLVSSKLKDWPISRQRHWGTPIPIVHCKQCGAVPLKLHQLPVQLPAVGSLQRHEPINCPSCGRNDADRELDTMDTFVDSSWYFLRFLDPSNDTQIFDRNVAAKMMPVDLYIGGKEHAVLHLYYARFVNHFLHSIGLVRQPEPFQRLLVQGMVMGKSYRVKGSGKYLREADVRVVNAKKNVAETLDTGEAVHMQWEKMSKSKLNGADPVEVIAEHGTDTIRLIMLGDVAPTSHRNWSTASKFLSVFANQSQTVVNYCRTFLQLSLEY